MPNFLDWEQEKAEAVFAAVIERWGRVVRGKQKVEGNCEFCRAVSCPQCFLAVDAAGSYDTLKWACAGTPYAAFAQHYRPQPPTCAKRTKGVRRVCCEESRALAQNMLVFLIEERIRYRNLKKERAYQKEDK